MLTSLSLVAVGFFLGMRHATDPDHVLAISTIVSRERSLRAAAVIGALWGLGHGVTVTLAGGLVILFGVVIPPRVGLAMEFAVGVMLVLLGLLTLAAVVKQAREALALHAMHGGAHGAPPADATVHVHVHAHGDYVHRHEHGHGEGSHGHGEDSTPQAWLDRHFGRLGPYQIARPLVVGVVHGLAGSAAVALLVLTAIRDPLWGLAYLAVFGAGTVAGMMLITVAIAVPFTVGAARLPALSAGLRTAAGVLSVGFGLFLMNQIGIADGLFAAAPH